MIIGGHERNWKQMMLQSFLTVAGDLLRESWFVVTEQVICSSVGKITNLSPNSW